MNSRASSASSKGSKESGDNKTRMTRCFAMLTLKLTNPDYNANEVQTILLIIAFLKLPHNMNDVFENKKCSKVDPKMR